uniref:DUF2924 domain-containing protein n=1 Tax=Altererythrobacter segetis TaxID=1104773 RepID=UPI00140C8850|nr:DUF2924 domain-containing protein [Altererythrobacter segetis]
MARKSTRPKPVSSQDAEAVTAEVRALATLNLAGLRQVWRCRYGAPPHLRSRELFARLLAWRMQADAFGGLDQAFLRLLQGRQPAAEPPPLPLGTRLTREWQGRRYQVEVTEEGFVHAGATYASLSAIARAITGTRWNGPRFFGLRQRSPK